MFKNKEKGIGSEKGFTMIELIIVIAIMGILSAILVPSFTQMTRKTRLRADVSTIQQVQTQIELYVAEHDGKYPADPDTIDPPDSVNEVKDAIKKLVAGEYLKPTDANTDGELKLQTPKLKVDYHNGEHLILDLDEVDGKVKKIAESLGASDQSWMDNYK